MSDIPNESNGSNITPEWFMSGKAQEAKQEKFLPRLGERLDVKVLIRELLDDMPISSDDSTYFAQLHLNQKLEPVLGALIRQEQGKQSIEDEKMLQKVDTRILALCYLIIANKWDGLI